MVISTGKANGTKGNKPDTLKKTTVNVNVVLMQNNMTNRQKYTDRQTDR